MKKVKIEIQNCSNEMISITKEPEAMEAFIAVNNRIEIETNDEEDNILINIGKNEDGTIFIQIWDALNTQYIVHHNGENLFK